MVPNNIQLPKIPQKRHVFSYVVWTASGLLLLGLCLLMFLGPWGWLYVGMQATCADVKSQAPGQLHKKMVEVAEIDGLKVNGNATVSMDCNETTQVYHSRVQYVARNVSLNNMRTQLLMALNAKSTNTSYKESEDRALACNITNAVGRDDRKIGYDIMYLYGGDKAAQACATLPWASPIDDRAEDYQSNELVFVIDYSFAK